MESYEGRVWISSGEPGLVDKVLSLHAGSRGFDSHRGHMPERFFRSNRPGYPHPVSSELENSGIRVAVGDCSVTERRRWRPPYQTGKTVHVHANTTRTGARRRVCATIGSAPLSHSGNVVSKLEHTLQSSSENAPASGGWGRGHMRGGGGGEGSEFFHQSSSELAPASGVGSYEGMGKGQNSSASLLKVPQLLGAGVIWGGWG